MEVSISWMDGTKLGERVAKLGLHQVWPWMGGAKEGLRTCSVGMTRTLQCKLSDSNSSCWPMPWRAVPVPITLLSLSRSLTPSAFYVR